MAGEIKGRTGTLRDWFEAGYYDIDVYQREYAWSADDVRNLADDLTTHFDAARADPRNRRGMHDAEPYFLGPFVYFAERHGARFLVDGQQRFTTLHLIFLHLHRQAMALGLKDTESRLDRVIRESHRGGWRYRIDIEERRPALDALYNNKSYEPPRAGASLSLRNLCRRSDELGDLLEQRIDADALPAFTEWLLGSVLVGIEAPTKDSGYRIFESMNDRGARLAPIDLLKSYLLSNVHQGEAELNLQWRRMLAELTPAAASDQAAPSRFLKAALMARYARIETEMADMAAIDAALHVWVRTNAEPLLNLKHPTAYFDFVDQLIKLATLYRTFNAAAERLDKNQGLQGLYYNHRNGLQNQMVLVLAAVQPEDTPSVANRKAALVANYVDRWFATRLLADEPALARDLDREVPDLVPQLRKCDGPEEVAHVLAAAMTNDDFRSVYTFGLRGNNLAQVRYLLARLTAFVEVGWGAPDLTEEYLHRDRPWQVEHIFPKHHSRHPEVNDPLEFRLLRNRLGVLLLLKGTVNMSLQDTATEQKFYRYLSENMLARCLHASYLANNKPLRGFIHKHDLASYLRPFNKGNDLRAAVELRQELHRRLCVAVWGRAALGFPEMVVAEQDAEAVIVTVPAPPRPRSRMTDLQRMIRDGVIAIGARVVGSTPQGECWAEVDDSGALVLASGDRYRKPDDAGQAVLGKRCRGMTFWQVVTPFGRVSLAALRDA